MRKPVKIDGAWEYKPAHVAELAALVKLGELLYTRPAEYGAKFDARRGESPRFDELQAALADRALKLVHEGAFYWRVSAHAAIGATSTANPATTEETP